MQTSFRSIPDRQQLLRLRNGGGAGVLSRLHRGGRAFTLLELLISIAIIAVLAGLLLPALSYAKEKARRAQCISNLKQVTLAMQEFSFDFEVYPWQLPPTEGGSQSMTQASKSFQVMSNYLTTPALLVCPSDQRQRIDSIVLVKNTNVSYFVGIEAQEEQPSILIAGDRNIEGGRPKRNCPVAEVYNVATEFSKVEIPNAGWSKTMHRRRGNIALGDGSAHQVGPPELRDSLLGSGDDDGAFNNHILLP